jgi:hypothetical protein
VSIAPGSIVVRENALKDLRSVTSIHIPSSVETIHMNAMQGLISLEILEVPFLGTSLTNPLSLSQMLNQTVSNRLRHVTVHHLHEGRVPNNAFNSISSLDTIVFYSDVEHIGDRAFKNLPLITSFPIEEGLISIGDEALENTSITELHIPSTVTSIGSRAFYGAVNITAITFESNASITVIGQRAFANLPLLQELELPNSLTSIGFALLEGNNALTKLSVPFLGVSLQSAGTLGYLFGQVSYLSQGNIIPTGLSEITITGSMNTLKEGSFYNATKLTTINIPNSITAFEAYVFYNNISLTSVQIPNQLKTIKCHKDYEYIDKIIQNNIGVETYC